MSKKLSPTDEQINKLLLAVIGEVDYDVVKTFMPECSEEPDEIPERLEQLRDVVRFHIRSWK